MKLIGVYGTLRYNEGNHPLLRDSRLIGIGHTEPKFKLVSMGGFPAMIPGDKKVLIEVYEVTDRSVLASLDSLEGHPNFYKRSPIKVFLPGTSEPLEVEVYQLNNPSTERDSPEYTHTQGDVVSWDSENNRKLWNEVRKNRCPI